MNIVVLKYNAGNIQSVLFALERIGIKGIVSDDPAILRQADKVIFPGVGEASSAMAYLRERKLDELLISLKQPVLGICLGMQLMCEHSEENDTTCMGIFKQVKVKKFNSGPNREFKVPQVGWNQVINLKGPLFNRIEESTNCYFVHGYYAGISDRTIAITDYIHTYSAAIQIDNFFGVQFHPEKSADAGEQLLRNFINL